MGAYINSLREGGTKEDCLRQIERLLDERDKLNAELAQLKEFRAHMRAVIEVAGFSSMTEALVEITRLRKEIKELKTNKTYAETHAKLRAEVARRRTK